MLVSSPHAWGCFLLNLGVFETDIGLPHMRGGVSKSSCRITHAFRSSPHAWGCFCPRARTASTARVFPTCVGVFLGCNSRYSLDWRLPHMRGGVSDIYRDFSQHARSSPHAWGCFRAHRLPGDGGRVFPTCVGVFPSSSPPWRRRASLPHMRGGVSIV